MVNYKKYNTTLYRFVLFLTMTGLVACGSAGLRNTQIAGKQLPVTEQYANVPEIEQFVAPYRQHIDKELDSVIAYCPETLDKSKTIHGWQTTIGNFMADVTFDKADNLLMQREHRHVDICLMNHGGIRSIIAKGPVTARTAFEIMPFENAVVVVALKGQQLAEIAQYLAKEHKPHPLAGMKLVLDKEGNVKEITVQGKPVQTDKIYNVATSDYLANGGDNMVFFAKGLARYDLDYKLRDLFIDYFKEVETLPVIRTERIIQEK
jgi:2',3'-cyclic-nucleotide 2'-phosphodiesterase (5'-nucleotidase family)